MDRYKLTMSGKMVKTLKGVWVRYKDILQQLHNGPIWVEVTKEAIEIMANNPNNPDILREQLSIINKYVKEKIRTLHE